MNRILTLNPLLKRAALLLLCLAAVLVVANAPASAQESSVAEWTPPGQVYRSERSRTPLLVPDAAGNLHLFWSGLALDQERDESRVLLYARWDGSRWTEPLDVVVTRDRSSLREPEVAIDQDGIIHVIFGGPTLQYTSAPADSADRAGNWTEPRTIGNGEFVNLRSDIEVDDSGALHVLVADSGTNEVYYITSADGGVVWSNPTKVSATPRQVSPSHARLAMDSQGGMHAVWTRNPLPEAYPPSGVFYARSDDGGATWTPERELAGRDHGEADIIVDQNDAVHVVFNGAATILGGKYHRVSADGGATWSDPLEIAPKGGGLNGIPAITMDPNGTLHFFGGDGPSLWVTQWRDGVWSPPIDLHVLRPEGFDHTETAQIAIVLGNQLHALFDDRQEELWHTWRMIDTEPVAPVPYTTPAPVNAAEAEETVVEVVDSAEPAADSAPLLPPELRTNPQQLSSPIQNIVLAIVLALAFLLLVIVVYFARQSRK